MNLPLLYRDRNGGLPGQNMYKRGSLNDLIYLTLPQPRLLHLLVLTARNKFSDLWSVPRPHFFFAFPFVTFFPYFLGFSLT